MVLDPQRGAVERYFLVAATVAFLPVSQLAPLNYPRVNNADSSEIISRLMKFIGHTFTVKIVTMDEEAGKIVAGDPDRLALTIGAALHGLVAMSIEGKIRGAALKAIVPETVQHVLNGLSTNKT